MSFQNVKGTRDFYPDQMRVRNWLFDAWRRVALRNGFEEYDSPILEYLDLYTAKSGPEIVSELFNLTDRGGRRLAIRPETTPTLARMVNAKINALPRPIKWFCIQRLCRAENPQKGRLREFFQWNIDVIGEDSAIADAECLFTACDMLREVGLAPADVKVHVGSRPLTLIALGAAGVGDAQRDAALAALDKRPKVSDEEFRALAAKAGLSNQQTDSVVRFQDCKTLEEVRSLLPADASGLDKALADMQSLFANLIAMGVGDYCKLDLRIVRGLAYYTGIVYEVFDEAGAVPRAIAGGGRYDNLLEVLGGPKVGATGFAMGDVVLGILLDEKGKLAAVPGAAVDFFVINAGAPADKVLEVVGRLRQGGRSAEFSYKGNAIGKQLKDANRRGAGKAVLVSAAGLDVKDLRTGQQQPTSIEELLKSQ